MKQVRKSIPRFMDSMRTWARESLTPAAPPGIRWRNISALVLCAFACIAMLGDITGIRALKGVGLASAFAPLPKVFSDMDGLEGFACEFTLLFDVDGQPRERILTPELYARLAGPYNRRNVYGAALAAGPRLPRPVWEAVFRHGLGPGGSLRAELDIPDGARNVAVQVRSKTRSRPDVWVLRPEVSP